MEPSAADPLVKTPGELHPSVFPTVAGSPSRTASAVVVKPVQSLTGARRPSLDPHGTTIP